MDMRKQSRRDDTLLADLQIVQCADGDISVMVRERDVTGVAHVCSAEIRTANGGGRSPHTWQALVDLLAAMERDNAS